MSVEKLCELSRRYGKGEEYVIAGGGNTSYKDGRVMHVKGSGTSLRTLTPEQLVRMDLEKLSAMLTKEYPEEDEEREAAALADMMASRLPGEDGKRPSVESILHAIFPYKYVMHTHPAAVNGLGCGQDGPNACRELFGGKVIWVPLTKPGYILASACRKMFEESRNAAGSFPRAAILQNHGLFVAADTPQEIDDLMDDIMGTLRAVVKQTPHFESAAFDAEKACAIAPALRMLYGGQDSASAVFCANSLVMEFVKDEASMRDLMSPFTPDHIVYCKHRPLFLSYGEDYRAAFDGYVAENGFPPKIVAVKGIGFFTLGKTKKEADTARLLFLDLIRVAVYARSFGGCNPLPEDYTSFILNWELQHYRERASFSSGVRRRLEGKIAIVAGTAQGFGVGIAETLAAHGANVVIADLNPDSAGECAALLEKEHGYGRALGVGANVADEESVKSMVQTAVLEYGGLDILISNAGVLITGGLEEMTLEQFELVTRVNYTGYFLCVKYACVPMKLQRQYCPGYMTDIIEISPKSGLTGNDKNLACVGSRLGVLGLTQSFALELIAFGVKVNAICPHNLFDLPLWSDPEKGLFRQYLDNGKVPGAKSVEDVRRFCEATVPMKRGCTLDDMACAVLYAIEQKYETGQEISVTGGQNMLN